MIRCKLLGHKWPMSSEMPQVDPNEPMVIKCKRCGHSEIVFGWLRDAFAQVEK